MFVKMNMYGLRSILLIKMIYCQCSDIDSLLFYSLLEGNLNRSEEAKFFFNASSFSFLVF